MKLNQLMLFSLMTCVSTLAWSAESEVSAFRFDCQADSHSQNQAKVLIDVRYRGIPTGGSAIQAYSQIYGLSLVSYTADGHAGPITSETDVVANGSIACGEGPLCGISLDRTDHSGIKSANITFGNWNNSPIRIVTSDGMVYRGVCKVSIPPAASEE